MSRGSLRFDEAELQQMLVRTRGLATSVGAKAPVAAPAAISPVAPAAPAAPAAATANVGQAAAVKAAKAIQPGAPRPMKISEDDLQISCFQWIELMRPAHPILEWIIHVPNGGKRPRGAAGRLKAMGVKPGVLDVLLPLPFNGWSGLAIEMKVGRNKTTDQQDDWLRIFEVSGYYTAVCYTLEDFMGHVNCFLGSVCRTDGRGIAQQQAAYLKNRHSLQTGHSGRVDNASRNAGELLPQESKN